MTQDVKRLPTGITIMKQLGKTSEKKKHLNYQIASEIVLIQNSWNLVQCSLYQDCAIAAFIKLLSKCYVFECSVSTGSLVSLEKSSRWNKSITRYPVIDLFSNASVRPNHSNSISDTRYIKNGILGTKVRTMYIWGEWVGCLVLKTTTLFW